MRTMIVNEEELIQWALRHGRMTEGWLRAELPAIRVFCAQYPISMQEYVECLVKASDTGVNARDAGKALRKKMKEMDNEV